SSIYLDCYKGRYKLVTPTTAENAAARKAFLIECERNLAFGEPAKLKLESCLADLMRHVNIFKDLLQGGIYQLCSTAVIPRLKPLIDGFNSTSHNISE
ncbi:Golgi transport complex subunit 4, partial [Desmophyllum pertusum]